MNSVICPMLSALPAVDAGGQPANRECIYEACRFFDTARSDCGLLIASRATQRLAEEAASRPPQAALPASSVDIEGPLGGLRGDLLQTAASIRDAVGESSRAAVDRVDALESKLADLDTVLGERLGEIEARWLAGVTEKLQMISDLLDRNIERVTLAAGERVDAAVAALQVALVERLDALLVRMEQEFRTAAAQRLEESQAMTGRLEEQRRGLAQVHASASESSTRLGELTDLQARAAERILEETSLVAANAHRMEQALAAMDTKLDRSTDDALQLSQLVTLVKGETERTYAALRSISEGNRTVVQAIETQLQRDQAELQHRRHEEALHCNNRGVALYYRGALEAAHESLRKAVTLHPEYAEAYNNLGLVLSRLGKEKEATEAFKRALTIDPRLGEAYNNLGFLYHTSLQFEQAAQMFGQAIQNAADSSIAYTNLGNSFYKMDQPDKAVEAWRRALELDPMNENARRGLRMFQQDASAN